MYHPADKNVRQGWADAFRTMAEEGDDKPIIEEENFFHSWDGEEWRWPHDRKEI
jgi:hypothetical protein